jgi:hypothetical protein
MSQEVVHSIEDLSIEQGPPKYHFALQLGWLIAFFLQTQAQLAHSFASS